MEVRMLKQLTVRGFDPELERRLRRLAREEKISLTCAAIRLMRKGAGLDGESRVGRPIGKALDRFFGNWTDEQADAIERAVEDFEVIDEEMWK
jgi:hypothetical protein